MSIHCISPSDNDKEDHCQNSPLGNSKFCSIHAKYLPIYLEYKKIEESIKYIFIKDQSDNLDIRNILKVYNRLSKAFELRIEFRKVAISRVYWDEGHDIRINVIYNMMEKYYNILYSYFNDTNGEIVDTEPENNDKPENKIINKEILSKQMTKHSKQKEENVEKLIKAHKTELTIQESNWHYSIITYIDSIIGSNKVIYEPSGDRIPPVIKFFLYHFYWLIYRTLKIQIYDITGYVLSSVISCLDINTSLWEIRHCIDEYKSLNAERFPRDDVLSFYESLDTEMIKYLSEICLNSKDNKIRYRFYRSDLLEYSLTFISELSPKIIVIRYCRDSPRLGAGTYRKENTTDQRRRHDYNSEYTLHMITPEEEKSKPPNNFRRFYNSITRENILIVRKEISAVLPKIFDINELISSGHILYKNGPDW